MIRQYPAATSVARDAVAAHIPRADEQAGCFYHPGRVADSLCDRCGRFVCALCVVEFKGQDHCPACLRQRLEQGNTPDAACRHLRYDKMALLLAIAPLFIWPFTIATGPIALYLGVRYWNRPVSLVTSGRGRLTVAILFGLVQTLGWIALLIMALNRWLR